MEFISYGILSAVLIAVSGIPYIWAIVTRRTQRPVIATWLVWTIIGFLFLITYQDAGAVLEGTLPAAIMGLVNPLVITILAMFYGKRGWTWLDLTCLVVASIAVCVWQFEDDPLLGLIGLLVADSMAAIPQIVKSFKDPADEPWFPWFLFGFGSAVNLLAIEVWTLEIYLFPLYMTVVSLMIALPIMVNRFWGLQRPT